MWRHIGENTVVIANQIDAPEFEAGKQSLLLLLLSCLLFLLPLLGLLLQLLLLLLLQLLLCLLLLPARSISGSHYYYYCDYSYYYRLLYCYSIYFFCASDRSISILARGASERLEGLGARSRTDVFRQVVRCETTHRESVLRLRQRNAQIGGISHHCARMPGARWHGRVPTKTCFRRHVEKSQIVLELPAVSDGRPKQARSV